MSASDSFRRLNVSERVLLFSEERNEKLIEWRDPTGKATEWVTEGDLETKVLFRWEGSVGLNASLFPGTMTMNNSWFIDMTAIERTLDYCKAVRKSDEILGLWLTECQAWFPDQDWTTTDWKKSFLRAVLPWISKSDPWISFRQGGSIDEELRTLFQAPSLDAGLDAVGFSLADPRLRSRARQSILSAMGDTSGMNELLIPVTWSLRLLPWLDTDELLTFWEPPLNSGNRFPYLFFKHKPVQFRRLMKAIKRNPQPEEWWFEFIELDSRTGWRTRASRGERRLEETIRWLEPVRWMYENSINGWSTRLPSSLPEYREWVLKSKIPVPKEWKVGDSIVVGLFHDGNVVTLSQWSARNALTQPFFALPLEIRQKYQQLLPWVFGGRVRKHRWDLWA